MGTLKTKGDSITVRMYRQGVGDCFLIALPTQDSETPYYVLIDCGVVSGTRNAKLIMTSIAEDISLATDNNIDLLVVTHPHWDHLSGFSKEQAGEIFDKMTFHNVWLPWTEDPNDPSAKKLRMSFDQDKKALNAAIHAFIDFRASSRLSALRDSLGPQTSTGGNGIWETLKQTTLSSPQNEDLTPDYMKPGSEPLSFPAKRKQPQPQGIRVYVLGPPVNEAMLRRMKPSSKAPEVYTEGTALNANTAFLAAVMPDDAEFITEELRNLAYPFEERLRIPLSEANTHAFIRENYGTFTPESGANLPNPAARPASDWRRIDDDWLESASQLALQLDSCTNNTSLVLAIEIIQSGKVLLFVGDAQVGNWLSWDTLSWTLPGNGSAPHKIDAHDLLSRTVLYKVGHHGSHNATLREKGLGLMTSPDLVAMLPVNEEVAHDVKHWMKMPFMPLLKELEEKTHGRIIRADHGVPLIQPQSAKNEKWKQFVNKTDETELFIQYEV